MTNEPSPRPWRIADGMQETIVDERNNIVANAANNATAALIVDAVNERDRLRAELADKTRNYEDVIAHHTRTEESLRDIVRRLLMLRRGDIAVPMDTEKQILAEARAAIVEGQP